MKRYALMAGITYDRANEIMDIWRNNPDTKTVDELFDEVQSSLKTPEEYYFVGLMIGSFDNSQKQ